MWEIGLGRSFHVDYVILHTAKMQRTNVPAEACSELGDDCIAVPEQLHVEAE